MALGYEDAMGYGDYKCSGCNTTYYSDTEYYEYGNEVEDDDN